MGRGGNGQQSSWVREKMVEMAVWAELGVKLYCWLKLSTCSRLLLWLGIGSVKKKKKSPKKLPSFPPHLLVCFKHDVRFPFLVVL